MLKRKGNEKCHEGAQIYTRESNGNSRTENWATKMKNINTSQGEKYPG